MKSAQSTLERVEGSHVEQAQSETGRWRARHSRESRQTGERDDSTQHTGKRAEETGRTLTCTSTCRDNTRRGRGGGEG